MAHSGTHLNVVSQAITTLKHVDTYITAGMETVLDIAQDFVEHCIGDCSQQIKQMSKIMLDYVKMKRDLDQAELAVEEVKKKAQTEGHIDLEKSLLDRLAELKSENNNLEQHEKYVDFLQRIWELQHPEKPTAESGEESDVAMTQQEINTRCLYTGKEMVSPMKNKICGHTYDREGIEHYLKVRGKRAKCPVGSCVNDQPITMSDLEENKELKRHIERKKRAGGKSKHLKETVLL